MHGLSVANKVSRTDLKNIPIPVKTASYCPISHIELVDYLEESVPGMLGDQYSLIDNSFGTARNDQLMFGMMTFKNSAKDMGLSVGYRNSIDRTLSVGLAFGANVFVCENLMLTGDVYVAKKHSPNVWDNLPPLIEWAVPKASGVYDTLREDVDSMKQWKIKRDQGYQLLGLLRGHNVLTAQQTNVAFKEYVEPSFKEHKDGSVMQVYNACTEALKSHAWPQAAIRSRMKLHSIVKDRIFPHFSKA
tara:strand:- start:248 stop:985 length:738 start_codon:yes stop_codon:yes gene_type:complete